MYGAGCWAYNQRCDRPGVAVATSGKILFNNQTVILIYIVKPVLSGHSKKKTKNWFSRPIIT